MAIKNNVVYQNDGRGKRRQNEYTREEVLAYLNSDEFKAYKSYMDTMNKYSGIKDAEDFSLHNHMYGEDNPNDIAAVGRDMKIFNPDGLSFTWEPWKREKTALLNSGVMANLNDQEKELFWYLEHKGGTTESYEFLKDISDYVNSRGMQQRLSDAYERGTEKPFVSSLESVGTNMLSTFESLNALKSKLYGRDININSPEYQFTRETTALRSGAQENINSGIGRFLYGTGMSLADNLARLPLAMIPGVGTAFAGSAAMMQAASQGIVRGKEEFGMDDTRALLYGYTVGAIEGLTEKYSVDTLLDKTKLAKSVSGYILKNMIAEGSEEMLSEVGDKIAQLIYAKDQAEIIKLYNEYKAKGLSDGEALGKVFLDIGGDVLVAGLSGALSGGGMSVGGVTFNAAANIKKGGSIMKSGADAQLKRAAALSDSTAVGSALKRLDGAKTGISKRYKTAKLHNAVYADAYNKLNNTDTASEIDDGLRRAFGDESRAESFAKSEYGQRVTDYTEKLQGKVTYNTSNDGRTYYEGKEVAVDELVRVEDGIAVVKLSDGREVKASDMQLSRSLANQYKEISRYDTNTARAFIDGFKQYSGSLEEYSLGFKTAYLLGVKSGDRGITAMLDMLTEEEQKALIKLPGVDAAFLAGKNYVRTANENSEKMKKVRAAKEARTKKGNTTGEKSFDSYVSDYENLTETKKRAVARTIEAAREADVNEAAIATFADFSAKSGIVVSFDKSKLIEGVDEQGNTVYADGMFDGDNTIYVNKDSRRRYSSLIFHELSHFLFKKADGMTAARLEKKLLKSALKHMDKARRAEIEKRYKEYYKSQNKTLTDDILDDEILAHYTEEIFRDVNILEYLHAEEPSLIQRIIGFFTRSEKTYAGNSILSREARKYARKFRELYREVTGNSEHTAVTNINGENMNVTGDNNEETSATTNTDVDTDTRYALPYDDAIDKLADGTLDTTLNTHLRVLEHTPQIYIDKAGASDREIAMSWDVAYLAMNKTGTLSGNYHGLGAEIMKALPAALEDPLYIVKQKNGRIAAVTKIVVKGKRAVFASIELEAYQTTIQEGKTEAKKYNLVLTVTDAKPNYLQNTIFSGEIVHNKNSEDPAHFILRLKSLKKAVPTYDLAGSSDNSITENAEKINPSDENSSKNPPKKRFALPETDSNGETLTDAQREYFADSKVLDENGNLLALYHGTPKENGEFYVFDYNKSKRKGGFGFASSGKGFYFTTKREAAEIYTRSGGRLLSVYVDIKNPYIVNGDIKEQISNDFGIDPLNVYLQEVRRILSSKGYDGIIQGRGDAQIVVAYYPEQIKLTSNKNPTADPDMRFALLESDSTGAELTGDQRKHSPGQAKKNEANVTKERFYSKADAESIINEIAANSLTFVEDNVGGVLRGKSRHEVIDLLWQGLNDAEPGKRAGVALSIADYIIEHAVMEQLFESEDVDLSYYKDTVELLTPWLRKLDLSAIRAEIRHKYDHDISPFSRWGTRRGSDGFTVDVVAQQLREQGMQLEGETEADLFFSLDEAYTSAKNALKKEGRVMMKASLKSEEIDSLRQSISREILNGFSTRGSQTKLARVMEKYNDKAKFWRARYSDEKKRSKAINNLFETVDRVRGFEKYQKADENLDKEVVGLIDLLKKIKTDRGNLSKNVREIMTKYAHVVGDGDNGKPLHLYDLLYDDYSGDGNPYAGRIESIARGEGELTTEELLALDAILRNFIHNVNEYHRVFMEGKRQDALEIAGEGIAEVEELILAGLKREYGETIRDRTTMKLAAEASFLQHALEAPVWRFERMGGYRENSVMMRIYNELAGGVSRQMAFSMRAAELYKDFFKKYGKEVAKWHDQTYTVGKNTTLGETKISKGQMISLYMTSLRAQGRSHLENDGGALPVLLANERVSLKSGAFEGENKGKDALISMLDIAEMYSNFGDAELEFIRLSKQFFKMSAEAKVETDEALYGVATVVEDNYFPLRVADDQIYKKLGDGKFKFADLFTVYSPSFTKKTVEGAKNKLVIENAIDVVNRHAKQMAAYCGLAVPVKTFNKLYNIKTASGNNLRRTARSLDSTFEGYVERLIDDMQGNNVIPQGRIEKLLMRVRSFNITATFALNVKIWANQLVSLPASFAVGVQPKYLVKGIYKALKKGTDYEQMFNTVPLLYDRFRNGNSIDVGTLKQNKGVVGKVEMFTDLATAPIGKIDAFVCTSIWNAALEQTKGGYEWGSAEHLAAAKNLTEAAVTRTQANYTPLYRPEILRSQSQLLSMFTLFKSESFQQYSLITGSFDRIRVLKKLAALEERTSTSDTYSKQLRKAKKQAVWAISTVVADSILLAGISLLFRYIKGTGEDDEKWWESFLLDLVSNYVGMIPLASEIYNYLIEGFDISHMSLTSLQNMLDAVLSLSKLGVSILSDEAGDTTDARAHLRKIIIGVGQATGIPFKNVEAYVMGLVDKLAPGVGYKYDSLFWDKSTSEYIKDFNEAMDAGQEKLADTILDIMLKENMLEIDNDDVRGEIGRLKAERYDVLPKGVGVKVSYGGEEKTLTKKERERFLETYNDANAVAASLIHSKAYTSLDDQGKARAISLVYDTYYELAREELFGVGYSDKKTLFSAAIDVDTLAVTYGGASILKADTDKNGNAISGSKKKKVEKYLDSLDLSQTEKYMLMGYLGYSNVYGKAQVKAYINSLSLTDEEKAELLKKSGY